MSEVKHYEGRLKLLTEAADRVRREYEMSEHFTGSYDLGNLLEKAMAELFEVLMAAGMTETTK